MSSQSEISFRNPRRRLGARAAWFSSAFFAQRRARIVRRAVERPQRPRTRSLALRTRATTDSAVVARSRARATVCMADVCLTAPAVLSPVSPNESRKRRHGSSGVQGTWFKRHRTGNSFARRLLHLRGFSVDVRQAEELARFIDQFPRDGQGAAPLEDLTRGSFFSTRPLNLMSCVANRPPRRPRPRFATLTPGIHPSFTRAGRLQHPREVRRHRRRHPAAHQPEAELPDARSAEDPAGSRDARGPAPGDDPAAASGRVPDDAAAAAAAGSEPSAVEAAEAEARAAAADRRLLLRSSRRRPPSCRASGWGRSCRRCPRRRTSPTRTNAPRGCCRRSRRRCEARWRARAAAAGGGGDASARAEILARENSHPQARGGDPNARQQEHGQTQQQVVALQRLCAQYQEQLQAAGEAELFPRGASEGGDGNALAGGV